MSDNWSHEETDDPFHADRRKFYKARASAGGFNGKSQHHYIKRFRIAAALTDALDITHPPVFAKHLRARISDRRDAGSGFGTRPT